MDNNFERFSNEDYLKLETLDFRSLRYKKGELYNSNKFEAISELESK